MLSPWTGGNFCSRWINHSSAEIFNQTPSDWWNCSWGENKAKTKHVVHVKVINLRWISSFLFFPPSPKSCFLLHLPREEGKVWVQSALGGKTMVFPHMEGKSFVVGWGCQGWGCRLHGKENDWLGLRFGIKNYSRQCRMLSLLPAWILFDAWSDPIRNLFANGWCGRRKKPRVELSSCCPHPLVPPEHPPSIFPRLVPGVGTACVAHWGDAVYRDLFSTRKQAWSLEDSNIFLLTKAPLIVFRFVPPFPSRCPHQELL